MCQQKVKSGDEIIIRNINPKDKFVNHMALELGLQIGIIENEGDA